MVDVEGIGKKQVGSIHEALFRPWQGLWNEETHTNFKQGDKVVWFQCNQFSLAPYVKNGFQERKTGCWGACWQAILRLQLSDGVDLAQHAVANRQNLCQHKSLLPVHGTPFIWALNKYWLKSRTTKGKSFLFICDSATDINSVYLPLCAVSKIYVLKMFSKKSKMVNSPFC